MIPSRNEPADDPVEEPADEPADDPVEEPADEPAAPVFTIVDTLDIRGNSDVINLSADDMPTLSQGTIMLSFDAESVDGRIGVMSRDARSFSGDGNHVSIYIEDGCLKVRLQDGSSEVTLVCQGIDANQAYHMAVTFDGSEAKLVLDGTEMDSASTSMTWETSPEFTQIGALGWTSRTGDDKFTNAFEGQIGDVRIYDEALSTDAIADLSDGTLPLRAEDPVADDDPAPQDDAPDEDPAPTPVEEPDEADDDDDDEDDGAAGSDDDDDDDDAAAGNDDDDDDDDNSGVTPDDDEPDAPSDVDSTPVTETENGTLISVGDGRVDVTTGRVSTLEHDGDDIASIEILSKPDWGNVTVNPDNTMALVLSMGQSTGNLSYSYKVTYDDGSTEVVDQPLRVVAGSQADGWGSGDYYTLEEGDDGSFVVEHGDAHRKVYLSDSDDALSASDIAALEGLSANQITGKWLAANPEYGADESMALKADIGMDLWNEITGDKNTSNWLLFERGYEYEEHDLGNIVDGDSSGESALHPLYFGAWGEGAQPKLNASLDMFKGPYENIVFQDLHFTEGTVMLEGNNILIDGSTFTNRGINAQHLDNLTVHNSDFYDIYYTEPRPGEDWTSEGSHRIQGIYAHNIDHLRLEGLFLDHVGWDETYREDLSTAGGQPPSILSHNLYIQDTNRDVSIIDSISMRASSFGAQVRPGGYLEGNAFIDNNVGFSVNGGDYKGAGPVGEYSLVIDNLVTSGAHKLTDGRPGGLTMGINNYSLDTTLTGNIVTHLANPDDPDEIAERYWTHDGLGHAGTPYYDDTQVYNWIGSYHASRGDIITPDQNIDGLDTNQLDDVTIQNFTADLLNQTGATINDLGEYLRALSAGEIDGELTAEDILDYFKEGFGNTDPEDAGPVTLRFTPDDRGAGTRWENPLNWTGEERPEDGDSVELGGNWVDFAGTIDLANLDFGDEGILNVGQGKLTVTGDLTTGSGGGELNIDDAGQIWIEDYAGTETLDINADGGRFANTGKFEGLFDLLVKDDAQAILGADTSELVIGDGSKVTIDGSDADVGFDGAYNGVSVLRTEDGGTLEFVADSQGISTIEEFRSGAYVDEDSPKVLSAFDMGEGTLLLDITELQGKQISETLIEADEIVGMFDEIQLVGLAGNQDATLTFDYTADTVTLSLSAAGDGSGGINIVKDGDSQGDVDNASIWEVLTDGQGTYEELQDTVTVNGSEYDEDDILAA